MKTNRSILNAGLYIFRISNAVSLIAILASTFVPKKSGEILPDHAFLAPLALYLILHGYLVFLIGRQLRFGIIDRKVTYGCAFLNIVMLFNIILNQFDVPLSVYMLFNPTCYLLPLYSLSLLLLTLGIRQNRREAVDV